MKVLIADLPDYIERTLKGVMDGVMAARDDGYSIVDMPDGVAIEFSNVEVVFVEDGISSMETQEQDAESVTETVTPEVTETSTTAPVVTTSEGTPETSRSETTKDSGAQVSRTVQTPGDQRDTTTQHASVDTASNSDTTVSDQFTQHSGGSSSTTDYTYE